MESDQQQPTKIDDKEPEALHAEEESDEDERSVPDHVNVGSFELSLPFRAS